MPSTSREKHQKRALAHLPKDSQKQKNNINYETTKKNTKTKSNIKETLEHHIDLSTKTSWKSAVSSLTSSKRGTTESYKMPQVPQTSDVLDLP